MTYHFDASKVNFKFEAGQWADFYLTDEVRRAEVTHKIHTKQHLKQHFTRIPSPHNAMHRHNTTRNQHQDAHVHVTQPTTHSTQNNPHKPHRGVHLVAGFSMASSPSSPAVLEFSVKRTDHPVTQYFHDTLRVGERVLLDGGHGDFSWNRAKSDSLVLIGGGIGAE